MKKNRKIFWLFILVAMIQVAVPLSMIWHWEDVLQNGRQYTWVTVPIDPYDALKGRYVDLQFKETKGPVQGGITLKSGQAAYALIVEDEQGYAFISGVSNVRPEGNSYVKVEVSYVQDDQIVHFSLPFKRYYMQEYLAPKAEIAYRENASKECVVLVRIKDGYGVVEQLYIGDKTMYEYLREE